MKKQKRASPLARDVLFVWESGSNMEQVQINGCSIAYNVAGEGIPIVFVGGLGMPKEGWYCAYPHFQTTS